MSLVLGQRSLTVAVLKEGALFVRYGTAYWINSAKVFGIGL